jgi:hypothetical protein
MSTVAKRSRDDESASATQSLYVYWVFCKPNRETAPADAADDSESESSSSVTPHIINFSIDTFAPDRLNTLFLSARVFSTKEKRDNALASELRRWIMRLIGVVSADRSSRFRNAHLPSAKQHLFAAFQTWFHINDLGGVVLRPHYTAAEAMACFYKMMNTFAFIRPLEVHAMELSIVNAAKVARTQADNASASAETPNRQVYATLICHRGISQMHLYSLVDTANETGEQILQRMGSDKTYIAIAQLNVDVPNARSCIVHSMGTLPSIHVEEEAKEEEEKEEDSNKASSEEEESSDQGSSESEGEEESLAPINEALRQAEERGSDDSENDEDWVPED